MHRPRSINRWGPQNTFNSPEEFNVKGPTNGLNTVHTDGELLDFYIENRNSTTTLVVFHAKLSDRESTLPVFSGFSLAQDTGCNLISASDPTLALGDIDLAWFLGDFQIGRYPDRTVPIFRKIFEYLGSDTIIFFGASGGAFAAVNLARHFPGVTVLAANPRLNLVAKPQSAFQQYLRVAHQVTTNREARTASHASGYVILKDSFPDGLPFKLCIFQNSRDSAFYKFQVLPFIRRHINDENLYLLTQDTGPGHNQVPGSLLRRIIEKLKESPSDAGFISVAEVLAP